MQKIFPATRPQWYNLKMKEMSKHSLQSGIEVKKNKNIKQARKKWGWLLLIGACFTLFLWPS